MKFSYDIFPDQRTIVTRYAGVFSLSELVAATQLMWSDPRYSREFDGLADASDGSVSVTMGDFRSLMEFLKPQKQLSRGRWAVVTSTPFVAACGYIYQRAMAGCHTLEVFSTWETACAFLNLNLPRDTPLTGGAGLAPN